MLTVTVAEASLALGLTTSATRKLCRDGVLPATRVGGAWRIETEYLPIGATAVDWAVVGTLDFDTAMSQIRSMDLREEWLPDIIRHEDSLDDASAVQARARCRLLQRRFDGPREIEVAKSSYFARPGKIVSLEERVAFHAVVAALAPTIEKNLSPRVYSARLSLRGRRYLTRKGTRQWQKWITYTKRRVKAGENFLIKTDITAYFDTIRHDVLRTDLLTIGCDPDLTRRAMEMIEAWSTLPGVGLIQGPDVSRIIGNAFLAQVDAVMLAAGFRYSRYMDYIRLTGLTKSEVANGLRLLERECLARGLILSPSKTQLFTGAAARDADKSSAREEINYLMKIGATQRAKRSLRRLLAKAISGDDLNQRDAKFSIWRLSKSADQRGLDRILNNLDELSPLASVVAEYLRHHIRKLTVERALSNYLADPEAIQHPYLTFYLFAVMLDRPGHLPAAWVSEARLRMRDVLLTDDLRIVCANVALRGGQLADIAYARKVVRSETKDLLARGFMVAPRRANALDDETVRVASKRSLRLQDAAVYLQNATDLPSVATLRRRVSI